MDGIDRAPGRAEAADRIPPLSRDASFWGMTGTQFLGAFNDNLFKQLVLLLCVDYVNRLDLKSDLYQTAAQALFAIPFVLFSGLGGWLSDRNSKRTIVVVCKIVEIAVMAAGLAMFLSAEVGTLRLILLLFAVLFFMGTQSAYFGPAKYGILPEMLHERDLPAANGVIQMTTFLAIIFGTAAAGFSKDVFQERLWIVSGICILIAVLGTFASFVVRRTAVANPGARFDISSLAINRETWKLLRSDRPLLGVLMISSLFWFVGGVVLPAVNTFGKTQMGIGDSRTSILAACMGLGIALGCVLAGKLSRGRIEPRLVTAGAWGIALCLALVGWIGARLEPAALPAATYSPQSLAELFELVPAVHAWEMPARLALTAMGLSAGLFVVPLQVFLQARPPRQHRGRVIGAMNLVNWMGILLAAGFYFAASAAFTPKQIAWTFVVLAAAMLPVALLYRPPVEALE